jgi:hypothetical protein
MRPSKMPRMLRRTVWVLYAVAVTSLAVYSSVTLVAVASPDTSQSVVLASNAETCPATGCTATSCHAETGQSPWAEQTQSSEASQGGATGGSSLQTCPATGCTATSCHATSGRSPSTSTENPSHSGGRQSSGFGRHGGSSATSDGDGYFVCPATGCTATSCHATAR